MEYYIEKMDSTTKEIISNCFPDYTGKKVKISTHIPKTLNSYWDGGSKTFYVFYELVTKKAYSIESNHPVFKTAKPRNLEGLPKGIVIVAHTIYSGQDLGITIYANTQDLAPLLPPKEEISEDEKIVLYFTRAYKSSYGGIRDYRFYEAHRKTGVTRENWDKALNQCVIKELLNKRKAITSKGRNAISDYHIF